MVDHEPSGAEQARSILAAAASLTVTAGGCRAHLSGRHAMQADGRLAIDVPADSGLVRAVHDDPDAPALVELTDVAPVAMRQRIRNRLTLAGWLTLAGHGRGLLLEPVVVRLADGAGTRTVDVDGEALAAAAPDPLAEAEAELLCHLADAHADAVRRLTRLVPAPRLRGLRAVHPVRLDRLGIVLRLEYPHHDADLRLPFGAPLRTAGDAQAGMLRLLTEAARLPARAATGAPPNT